MNSRSFPSPMMTEARKEKKESMKVEEAGWGKSGYFWVGEGDAE